MNRTSNNEVYPNGSPARSALMTSAERELSAFFSAVAERFGPQEAALAAKDWVRELELMTDLPTSPRGWRVLTIGASARLAKRRTVEGSSATR